MICCFMNFHEQETEKDLIKHFDREIDMAIARGCSTFWAGTKYPEDKIFADRVTNMAKFYDKDEIELKFFKDCKNYDEEIKNLFLKIADWEIYAYDTGDYPVKTFI